MSLLLLWWNIGGRLGELVFKGRLIENYKMLQMKNCWEYVLFTRLLFVMVSHYCLKQVKDKSKCSSFGGLYFTIWGTTFITNNYYNTCMRTWFCNSKATCMLNLNMTCILVHDTVWGSTDDGCGSRCLSPVLNSKLSPVGRAYSWMGDHLGIATCWFSKKLGTHVSRVVVVGLSLASRIFLRLSSLLYLPRFRVPAFWLRPW